jgi:hypothetical protein
VQQDATIQVSIHVFLTSTLVGGKWSASRPGLFAPHPGKEPLIPIELEAEPMSLNSNDAPSVLYETKYVILCPIPKGRHKLKVCEIKELRTLGREREREIMDSATAGSTLWFLERIVIKSSQVEKNLSTKGIQCFWTWGSGMRNRQTGIRGMNALDDSCLRLWNYFPY